MQHAVYFAFYVSACKECTSMNVTLLQPHLSKKMECKDRRGKLAHLSVPAGERQQSQAPACWLLFTHLFRELSDVTPVFLKREGVCQGVTNTRSRVHPGEESRDRLLRGPGASASEAQRNRRKRGQAEQCAVQAPQGAAASAGGRCALVCE